MKNKEYLKEGFRLVLNHFMMITTVLLIAMGLIKLFSDSKSGFDWYFPFQIICVAFSTAILSLIYVSKEEQSKKNFLIRVAIHYVLLNAVVLGEGYLFKWWTETYEMLIVIAVFVFVYVCVWIFTMITDKKTSNDINKALKNKPNKEDK